MEDDEFCMEAGGILSLVALYIYTNISSNRPAYSATLAINMFSSMNISLNYYFLTQTDFGISGVAIASLISMVLFNLSKLIFIYQKFKIIPFDSSYLKLITVMFAVTCLSYFLPKSQNSVFDLLSKLVVLTAFSMFFVYKLKLLPVFNFWVDKLLKKIN